LSNIKFQNKNRYEYLFNFQTYGRIIFDNGQNNYCFQIWQFLPYLPGFAAILCFACQPYFALVKKSLWIVSVPDLKLLFTDPDPQVESL
jgi:hypothetical protein